MTQDFINSMNTWSKGKPLKESKALSERGKTDESSLKNEFNYPEPN